jgi:hypothetical protein
MKYEYNVIIMHPGLYKIRAASMAEAVPEAEQIIKDVNKRLKNLGFEKAEARLLSIYEEGHEQSDPPEAA